MNQERPQVPPGGTHLWRWFEDLSNQRSGNGMGPNAIQFTEIEAWGRITRRRVKRWELSALLAMDQCFRDVVAEQVRAEAGGA